MLAELDWVMERAVEHLGPERAGRYLRKFYPWYVELLAACDDAPGLDPHAVKELNRALQLTAATAQARTVLEDAVRVPVAA